MPVVKDAREARDELELRAEPLLPERLDFGHLREEAVAADVEAITLVGLGARDPADVFACLEYDSPAARARERQRSGETRGPGPDDRDRKCAAHAARSIRRARGPFSR